MPKIDCNIAEKSHHISKPQRGLRNVILDYTSISKIDGKDGLLEYCGISFDQLIEQKYIDVAFLLFHGRYPTSDERSFAFTQIKIGQQYEEQIEDLIGTIAENCPSPIKFILSVVSLFRAEYSSQNSSHWSIHLQLQGFVSAAICHHAALAHGLCKHQIPIRQSLPEWVLSGLSGRLLSTEEKQIIESLFVVLAECITNPGTFAARIATSTETDYESAIIAAMAVFSGTKHGGATDDVMSMIADIGDPEYAADWVYTAQQENRPIPGFGHRVFRVPDPRAKLLSKWTNALAITGINTAPIEIIEKIIDVMAPMRRHGIHVNVDAYTGVILTMLGVPRGYGTLIFTIARMAGWAAHIEEQSLKNIMINPLVSYRPRQV